jgi:hypothetical protein
LIIADLMVFRPVGGPGIFFDSGATKIPLVTEHGHSATVVAQKKSNVLLHSGFVLVKNNKILKLSGW